MIPFLFSMLLLILSTGCVPIRSSIMPPTWVTHTPTQQYASASSQVQSPFIRVAIGVNQLSVPLVVPSQFELEGLSPEDVIKKDQGGQSLLSFNVTVHEVEGMMAWIRPEGEGEIQVDGVRYPGSIELIAQPSGDLTVVNKLPLEEYVMGVLAGEVPSDWPLEALKAQAIAARTFALYQQDQARKEGRPYDLESTAQYQMYVGSRLVNQNIRQAVMETQGEILTFQDKPIMAVFNSNCGGETASSKEVWGQDEPYLRPEPSPFSAQGAHYRWREKLSVADVVRQLRKTGMNIDDIVAVDSIVRDESGRIIRFSLMDGEGIRHSIKGTAFRAAVGPDQIRSTCFNVQLESDQMVFNGRGWGHGVGLCQEGACGMAKAGYSAFDILRHYYYGVILDQIGTE